MLLSEFSKMLGAEINEFETKPELSKIKKLAIEYIVAVEDKLISQSLNCCTNKKFVTLLEECSQNANHKKNPTTPNPESAAEPGLIKTLEKVSTAGSLDSLEGLSGRKDSLCSEAFDEITNSGEQERHGIVNTDLAEQIKERVVSRFEDLEKDFGDVHECCYTYAVVLFKQFVSQYSESNHSDIIHSTISPKGLFLTPNNDVLTPVRLFKACFLIAFKMLEEDFELFLVDFCHSMGEDVEVFGKIEVLVCLERLDFGFGGIDIDDLKREEEFLRDLLE